MNIMDIIKMAGITDITAVPAVPIILLGLLCFFHVIERKENREVTTFVKIVVFTITMISFFSGVLFGVSLK